MMSHTRQDRRNTVDASSAVRIGIREVEALSHQRIQEGHVAIAANKFLAVQCRETLQKGSGT